MGFKTTQLAYTVPDLSGPQKAVLVALSHCMNDQTGLCCPGQAVLTEMTALAEKTVRRALDELETRGLITRQSRFKGRYRIADTYKLLLDSPSVTVTTGQSDHRSESPSPPVTESMTTGQSDQAVEQQESQQEGQQESLSSEFDEFWLVYPKHQGKADALKAYKAARKTTGGETILAGAQAYKLASLGGDPHFVKLAGGWLRGKRWEDEDLTPATPKADPDAWMNRSPRGTAAERAYALTQEIRRERRPQSPTDRAMATLRLGGSEGVRTIDEFRTERDELMRTAGEKYRAENPMCPDHPEYPVDIATGDCDRCVRDRADRMDIA